jgi:hypothetical protein
MLYSEDSFFFNNSTIVATFPWSPEPRE